MSRSNNDELVNPASKFFEWSGAMGSVTYYDKDTGKNIEVPQPFRFLVLDRVAQVTGGIDTASGYLGYWSNAVKNISIQPLCVKSKQGTVIEGLYKDIKAHAGIKFMTGLYIAYKDESGLKIGYLKIKGSSLSAWIEATKNKNIFKGAFSIIDKVEELIRALRKHITVFSWSEEVSEQTDSEAIELDKQLQVYMTNYFGKSAPVAHEAVDQDDYFPEDFDEKIPF